MRKHRSAALFYVNPVLHQKSFHTPTGAFTTFKLLDTFGDL